MLAEPSAPDRAALDSSALLGVRRRELVAAAELGYYRGFWSSWIVAEFVRKRTEWIADRAAREGLSRTILRRRLLESRQRINRQIEDMSRALASVDYQIAKDADISWLRDPDDWPVMQTAIAAGANVLITDNRRDFPIGEVRNNVVILTAAGFLMRLYERLPDAEAAIRAYRPDH